MGGLGDVARSLRAPSTVQFARYLAIGSANTALSYGVYALGIALGFPYPIASFIALLIGIAVGFVAQGALVFRRRLQGRLPLFLGLWVLLYFANVVLIGALSRLGLGYYLAGLVAAIPITLLAYAMQKRIVFAEQIPAAGNLLIAWMVAMLAIARIDIAFRYELNWDEFLNLSMVYSHARGDLTEILQTAFIHLLWWVPYVSANEADQLIAVRMMMILFVAVTSFAIYGTTRTFASISGSLIAVLAFNSFTFVMLHGAEVRTDTISTTLMLVVFWLVVSGPPGAANSIAIGVLTGLAGAITIKAVFYLPTLGLLLLVRLLDSAERHRNVRLIVFATTVGIASFLCIVALHSMTFPDNHSPFAFVARTSGETLFSGDYSIILHYLPVLLGENIGFWFLVGNGIVSASRLCWHSETRRKGMALLSLSLPLLALAIYRDAYPYFFPFILAPVAVLAGFGAAQLSALFKPLALTLLSVSAIIAYVRALAHDNLHQRVVLAQVHRLFPHPVPYIDHASMVSSYPKQGIFMSRWGMTDYRRKGEPIMLQIVSVERPRFLLVTRDLLDVEKLDPEVSQSRRYGLLAADVRVLKENYQRYWGPIYLPRLEFHGSGTLTVQIPGSYRLEAAKPIEFGSSVVRPGAVLSLNAGTYRFRTDERASLRWAAPAAPRSRAPDRLFEGF